jgi:hypothetical protein
MHTISGSNFFVAYETVPYLLAAARHGILLFVKKYTLTILPSLSRETDKARYDAW